MKNKKKIYIVNGVTGVIGSPIFTYLVQQKDSIVYGISRRGLSMQYFLGNDENLPEKHLVFSLGDFSGDRSSEIDLLVKSIPGGHEIVFVYSLGAFLTEIDQDGKFQVKNDLDQDGINDYVKKITYDTSLLFAKLFSKSSRKVTYIQIGSLSDKWNLRAHYSWVKSMTLLKEKLAKLSNKYEKFNTCILNVSSVLTPKELIDRPFVTVQTDAEIAYWLNPLDIGKKIHNISDSLVSDYSELELFNPWKGFRKNHFNEDKYIQRRILELFPGK